MTTIYGVCECLGGSVPGCHYAMISHDREYQCEIRDQFDKQFQKPFIITFWLLMIGFVSMILGITIDHIFLNS